jgi:hypothetical protein
MNDKSERKETILRFLTPIIATLIASLVATYATYTYNERQVQLAHIEALDKYRAYINSEDYITREYGFFVFEELGYSKLVDKLADVREDPAALKILLSRSREDFSSEQNIKTVQLADKIMRRATSPEQDIIPPPVSTHETGTLKEGWVYLGHFISEESKWKTRYLDFSADKEPANLVGETLEVRRETGALNVRKGMPTVSGQFREVQEVLDVGSRVNIINYSEWLSSGYMWAQVRYGT